MLIWFFSFNNEEAQQKYRLGLVSNRLIWEPYLVLLDPNFDVFSAVVRNIGPN